MNIDFPHTKRHPGSQEKRPRYLRLEALEMGSKPIPIMLKGFAKMLFTLNPDAFGNRLENAERWLQECIERATKESEDRAKQEMRRFLADFQAATMH